MSRFLNLSKSVINTSHIAHISKKTNMYEIYFVDHIIDGYLIFGGGGVSSANRKMTCCKKTDPDDYTKVEQWIKVKGTYGTL